ncbi:unnamed protein product [Psylliodes chrysocephalus]|uniref:Uncharacterized protein n=1 Tax=Psylliodes chrysocephalus TaxID=3402493 RepID=A0A9P0CZI2_9CUCU|nr:unnamed protein product [Psylliodes chrysocephala]
MNAPSCSTSTELHHLKTTPLVKGFTDHKEYIPSPFKRVLFWKEDGPIEVKKKRKEKLPAIVTSPQMLEYFNKKLNTKKEMERQKEERKLAREEKKGIWDKKKAESKQKTKKATTRKKRFLSSSSSSSNDSSTRFSLQEFDILETLESEDEEDVLIANNMN